ncbi:uncharacterized protein METZ01_LOCUS305551, partial [marine metagenome]
MAKAALVSALTLLMVLSTVATSCMPLVSEPVQLDGEPLRMEQLGGGGSLEDQCGSITFENLFEYTRATFQID